MKFWQLALIIALAFSSLWILSPRRSAQNSQPGVIEISYMGPAGPIAAPMEDAVREFERLSREAHKKDPSRPIYRVISGQNASRDPVDDPSRFLVSVAGGTPPDLISFDRYAVSEWAARAAFTPLDPFLEKDRRQKVPDAIKREDFYKPAWDEAIYTDPISRRSSLYGIPYSLDNRILYYNKDFLKQGGFVDSSGEARPPKTWEELEAMAVKLTTMGDNGQPERMGFIPNQGNTFLYLYGWMNGGEFMSSNGKTCTLNDPKIVDALQWITHIYDELGGAKEVYAFQSTFQAGDLDPFITGKIAMKIEGVWMLDGMAQFATHLNWGAAPPPMPRSALQAGRKPLTWMGGWCYAIPSSAKHKDAAWELIRYLSSEKAVLLMNESQHLTALSQGRSFVPVQHPNIKFNEMLAKKFVYDDPTTDPKVANAFKVYNSMISASRYRPVTMVGQLLWNQQITAMEDAIFHKLSPKDALDRGQEIVQRQLDANLHPIKGRPLRWSWFIMPYAIIVLALIFGAYFWDTRQGLRAAFAGSLRHFGGKKLLTTGGDIDGIHSSFLRSQWKSGWLLASPWIAGFILFTGGPIAFSILISFCRYDILNPAHFVGVDNYTLMLTQDPLFWKSLWNTIYMVAGIPLGMALSLAIALLLNLKIKAMPVWRTFFYLPSIIPAVASSILWVWILNPSSGLLNTALASVGLVGPNWLQDEHTSKAALILMGLWGAGGGMIVWLAGLKGISESYYEAASLDGAGTMQKFVHVTLPMLSPYIFFNVIMGLIGTFQIFTQAFVMTKGGPVNSTLFYVYALFNQAFRFLNMGYAAAMAWFLFLIVFGLTYMQLRLSKHWVHYEGA